jgi:hypothetical protein
MGDNSAVNPLGHFIKNILIEVAVRGPQDLNATRAEVQEQLEQSYEYLESDLEDARDLLVRYPEYLAKHPIEGERSEVSDAEWITSRRARVGQLWIWQLFELSEYVGSTAETSIELTRKEFHKLKAHLAKMRGYAVQGPMGDDHVTCEDALEPA